MSLPTSQKVWILANPPAGVIESDTFKLEERPLPALQDGEVLIRVEAFSNDPAQRGWMQKGADPDRAYSPPVLKGDPVRASGVATILASKSQKWKEGQRVFGYFAWFDVGIISEQKIIFEAVNLPNQPFASLSVLGMVAVTAYHGLFDILDIKAEHTLIVSGAAGAVGSTVVQIAKHAVGVKKVIGIAGGAEKCAWVKSLGADECVDYKASSFAADLKAAVGKEGAHRIFENVGGEILNQELVNTARHAKIGICGLISSYNGEVPLSWSNFGQVIAQRLEIHGFLVLDADWPKALGDLAKWVQEGKIQTQDSETLVDGSIEDVPVVWQRLFKGENRGKLITVLKN